MKIFLLSILLTFSLASTAQNVSDTIYRECDTMPEFPGGWKEYYKFKNLNLKYPIRDGDYDHIQGRVTVRFVVTKEGKIESPTIIKGLDLYCDKEALRIVSIMPDWIPGRRNGEAVNVYFHLPIVFRYPY